MMLLGKYDLQEEIGRGGFGIVYRAVDLTLEREVALKVLHPQLTIDPYFMDQFRNEAKLIAALDNMHIVTIYEMGEAEGRVFIAMRYMAGGSLRQRLENQGAIPFEKTMKIVEQICIGLQTAHKKGLVHRDIKPANVLFDSEGNVVISDFGLAKAIQQSSISAVSSTGSMGTPAYRAPELWRGKPPASPATDIYSLGCVLCELLTGRVLFEGETPEEIITQHLVDGPNLSDLFVSGEFNEIGQVILKMLSKDPGDRYKDAFEVLQILPKVKKSAKIAGNNAENLLEQAKAKAIIYAEQNMMDPNEKNDAADEALKKAEALLEEAKARASLIAEQNMIKQKRNDDYAIDFDDSSEGSDITADLAVKKAKQLLKEAKAETEKINQKIRVNHSVNNEVINNDNQINERVLEKLKEANMVMSEANKKLINAQNEGTPKKIEQAKKDAMKATKDAAFLIEEAQRISDLEQNSKSAIKNNDIKRQMEIMHKMTHQDLLNMVYKASEILDIAPWVMLRAAGWGDFTNDRGKKYNGPAIDDIKGLDYAQKKALKNVLGF